MKKVAVILAGCGTMDGSEINETMGSGQCRQAKELAMIGCKHTETNHGGVAVDKENNIYSTPCFMLDARLKDVYQGAWNLVEEMIKG